MAIGEVDTPLNARQSATTTTEGQDENINRPVSKQFHLTA